MPAFKRSIHPTLNGASTADLVFECDCEAIEIINRAATDMWVTVAQFRLDPITPIAEGDDVLFLGSGAIRSIPTQAGTPTRIKILGVGKVSIAAVGWGE
jgi:hypothetical protein